jgi:phosphopantetheinyl transferase
MTISGTNIIKVLVASLDGFTEESISDVQAIKKTSALDTSTSYAFWKDQLRTEVGLILIQHLLTNAGIDEQRLQTLTRNRFGKPFLPHHNLDFNVSHSENIVVAAFSTTKSVGIDIEHNRSVDVAAYRSFFHPQERSFIESANTLNKFFEVWTKKESLLKARGVGFQVDLATVNIFKSTDEQHYFHPIQVPHYTCFVCSTFPCDNVVVDYCTRSSDLFLL